MDVSNKKKWNATIDWLSRKVKNAEKEDKESDPD